VIDIKKSPNKRVYLIFISLASAMGGLLFGYDWVVIGGTIFINMTFYDVRLKTSLPYV